MDKQQSRISNFPIMFFALIMGFSGITLLLEKSHVVLGFPHIPAQILSWLTFLFFIAMSGFYIAKMTLYRDKVIKEFNHPVRINFYAAFSISILLLSTQEPAKLLGINVLLAYLGVVLQSYITLYVVRYWIERAIDPSHASPAWFIPVVGNLLIPVMTADLFPDEMLYFFFSIGMFFWVVLFAVLAYRIIFYQPMPQKFMPTLFIFIAPPVFGFLNYIKFFNEFDCLAIMLYDLGLFFVLLLLFMYKSFLNIKFFISWWAFIFPLAAFTIATLVLYDHYKSTLLLVGSYTMICVSLILFFIVSYKTIEAIIKKEICIEE